MDILPLFALLAGWSWLLAQRYGPSSANWRALRTVRRKAHLLAEIAPAAPRYGTAYSACR